MARAKYYWPTMRLDIERHIALCLSCAETKGTKQTAPILEYPLPAGPFDVIGIDLLQLPRSLQGSTYVLVCVDHFSSFTVLAPMPDKSATAMAHAIISYLICPYTTPRVLLADNGAKFNIRAIWDICFQFHIQQTFTTSHHTASIGLVERTKRKILDILCHLAEHIQETWEDLFSYVSASINISVNFSTGLTTFCMDLRNPYFTMWLCTLLFPCTHKTIILNFSFTASNLSTTLFGINFRLYGKRCFTNSTLRLPQFILMSAILS